MLIDADRIFVVPDFLARLHRNAHRDWVRPLVDSGVSHTEAKEIALRCLNVMREVIDQGLADLTTAGEIEGHHLDEANDVLLIVGPPIAWTAAHAAAYAAASRLFARQPDRNRDKCVHGQG